VMGPVFFEERGLVLLGPAPWAQSRAGHPWAPRHLWRCVKARL